MAFSFPSHVVPEEKTKPIASNGSFAVGKIPIRFGSQHTSPKFSPGSALAVITPNWFRSYLAAGMPKEKLAALATDSECGD